MEIWSFSIYEFPFINLFLYIAGTIAVCGSAAVSSSFFAIPTRSPCYRLPFVCPNKMASVPGPSTRPPSTRFPQARLRVIAADNHEKTPCNVFLALSHRLFWIPLTKLNDSPPHSLYDFRNHSSLELTCLAAERPPGTTL